MDIAQKLRDKGIRVTPQRKVIYEVLTRLCHCSVEEMVAAVAAEHPDVTVSTVYNVLDCFADRGLIARLSTSKGKLYYDINTTEHHHIINQENEVADYKDAKLTELISEHLKNHPIAGYTIDKVSLQIYAKRVNKPLIKD